MKNPLPRYIRRHFAALTDTKTRRQRKQARRIRKAYIARNAPTVTKVMKTVRQRDMSRLVQRLNDKINEK